MTLTDEPPIAPIVGSPRRVPACRRGGNVLELQRRRLLSATAALVLEHGVGAITVASVSARAGVSRKTFYEVFADCESCLLVCFEHAVERAEAAVALELAAQTSWRTRIRVGVAALLAHLDRFPADAHVLIVAALGAGEPTLQARASVLQRLSALVDQGRAQARREPPELTAEAVVGAVFSVLHARLLAGARARDGAVAAADSAVRSAASDSSVGAAASPSAAEPLTALAGPLTAIVVQPYLGLRDAEQELAKHQARLAAGAAPVDTNAVRVEDPLKDLPMRLTYRTALVLEAIARAPGASSRRVGVDAGVSDPGQASRLLTRLQRLGLVENRGEQARRGEAKEWALTERGEAVLRTVADV